YARGASRGEARPPPRAASEVLAGGRAGSLAAARDVGARTVLRAVARGADPRALRFLGLRADDHARLLVRWRDRGVPGADRAHCEPELPGAAARRAPRQQPARLRDGVAGAARRGPCGRAA